MRKLNFKIAQSFCLWEDPAQADVTLKSICPGKKITVSIILSEIGADGISYSRGVTHILVPAQRRQDCRDLHLDCIPFSVPEAPNPNVTRGILCALRNFQVRVIANDVYTDFSC